MWQNYPVTEQAGTAFKLEQNSLEPLTRVVCFISSILNHYTNDGKQI